MTEHALECTIDANGGILYAGTSVNHSCSVTINETASMGAVFIEALMEGQSSFTISPVTYPLLNIRNSDNYQIDGIDFESVFAGHNTIKQLFSLINNFPGDIAFDLEPIALDTPVDSPIDSYLSQYLSQDDTTYASSLNITLTENTDEDLYTYYQPPSTAKIGDKNWKLRLDNFTPSGFSFWQYMNNFTLTSTSTTNQENVLFWVTVPYVAGKMETDFSDIRFHLTSWELSIPLEYAIDYKVDSSYAVFLIKIPLLRALETLNIVVLGGNSSVNDGSTNVFTEHYDWLDGTLLPWVHTGSQNGLVNTVSGWGHNSLELLSYVNGYWSWVNTPSEAINGRWTLRFKIGDNWYPECRYYLINNGVHSYSVRFDQASNAIGLYLDETLLTSTTWAGDEATHILVVTRTIDGLFNVYIDNTLLLTATDNSVTTNTTTTLGINARYWFMSFFVDYINFVEYLEDPPTVGSLGTWEDLSLELDVKAGVLYQSQELPEFEPIIRHGCRIGGVLYD